MADQGRLLIAGLVRICRRRRHSARTNGGGCSSAEGTRRHNLRRVSLKPLQAARRRHGIDSRQDRMEHCHRLSWKRCLIASQQARRRSEHFASILHMNRHPLDRRRPRHYPRNVRRKACHAAIAVDRGHVRICSTSQTGTASERICALHSLRLSGDWACMLVVARCWKLQVHRLFCERWSLFYLPSDKK